MTLKMRMRPRNDTVGKNENGSMLEMRGGEGMSFVEEPEGIMAWLPPLVLFLASSFPSAPPFFRPSVQNRREVASLRSSREVSSLARAPLSSLASQAAALASSSPARALALYETAFARVRRERLTHRDLHVAYANAASIALRLEMFAEALDRAERAEAEARRAAGLGTGPAAGRSLRRGRRVRGRALLGLGRVREAVAALEGAVEDSPLDVELRVALQDARQKLLDELVHGAGRPNERGNRRERKEAGEGLMAPKGGSKMQRPKMRGVLKMRRNDAFFFLAGCGLKSLQSRAERGNVLIVIGCLTFFFFGSRFSALLSSRFSPFT